MRKIQRSDIIDYQTYNDARKDTRERVLAEKSARRVHVGECLTFLFETTLTMTYQVQEMMRLEHMARESSIQHEIDTYNQLLGDTGELGCTLLIEFAQEQERDEKLRQLLGLPQHLYILCEDGERVRAKWDPTQVGGDRLSSVQYLKFPVGERKPVAIGSDHPGLTVETRLTDEQQKTLASDLREDAGSERGNS